MKLNQHFFTNSEERTEFIVSLLVLILAGAFIGYVIWPENVLPKEMETQIMIDESLPEVDDADVNLSDEGTKQGVKREEKSDISENLNSIATPQTKTPVQTEKEDGSSNITAEQELEVPKLETLNRTVDGAALPRFVEPEPNAFLVVHSFAVEKNALNFSERLKQDGYRVDIRRQKNGWHSVGVPFNTEQTNMAGLVQALSQEYDAQPVLWEKL